MSLNLVLVACILACVQPIFTGSVPFITKCEASDSKCIKTSAQAAIPIFAEGIKEYGVEKIDPFFLKTLDASSTGLKLHLNDITATGLGQCIAKKIQFNADKTKLTVKLLCTVDARGKYDISGQLLVLKIEGNGNAHVVLRKLQITADLDMNEVKGADGLPHWNIAKWKHTYELLDKATVELDNLFNGNDVLGRAAKELIATSPNEIVVEVGPPIVNAVVAKIVKSVNKFFSKVPVDDLIQ